jgi:hypothetical protein
VTDSHAVTDVLNRTAPLRSPTATDTPAGISAGAITGAVIGSVVAVIVIAGGLIWYCKVKRLPTDPYSRSSDSSPAVSFAGDTFTGSQLHGSLLSEQASYEGSAGAVPPLWNGVPTAQPPTGEFWQI